MIKLSRPDKPVELTEDVVQQKTEHYKATEETVWDEDYIKDPLLAMSFQKCCYCECDLSEADSYPEVEHFHDKHDYPDEVVEWDNLLPACKRCNSHKSNHDTIVEPIVNPAEDVPQDYMKLVNCSYFHGIDEKGKMTVKTLDLNEFDRMLIPRGKVAQEMTNKIGEILEDVEETCQQPDVTKHKATRLKHKVRDLLMACRSENSFSAVKTTAVLTCPMYHEMKDLMLGKGWWEDELEELETTIAQNKYRTI